MARAITSGELTKLRADGHFSRLYLAIELPDTVYSARVNQASFSDPVASVTYDGGSGTLGDVKIGMTMLVGSSAGAYDKGVCRIRKAPSATVFYVGYESEVEWADNLYLTVVEDFLIWPKHPSDDGSIMDYDVTYSDQHDDLAPVPVMGPDAVVQLTGSTVDHQRDASDSWVLGSTISTYAWTAAGPSAVVIDDDTAANPTMTFDTVGWYLIGLTVTAANGKSSTAYRKTYVWDTDNMPVEDFELASLEGSREAGGWNFAVRLYDDAALSAVRDEAKVILFARDYYQGAEESLGPLSGFENVIAIGRIDGETIEWNPDYTDVRFECKGPAGQMDVIDGSPIELSGTGATPTAWSEFEALTVDKALFHLIHWRSTISGVMDVQLTDDTRLAQALSIEAESLFEQIRSLAEKKIQAYPVCDRYGRLFVEIDTQVMPSGDRGSIPTVMTLTTDDWSSLRFDRKTVERVNSVELGGVYYDGSEAKILLSRAAGAIWTRFGRSEPVEDILLSSQSQANALSGDLLAWRNNPYRHIDIEMPQNNRMIDIAPRQYLVISVAAGDTVRGITLSSQKIMARNVSYDWNPAGYWTTRLDCEKETSGTAGETVPYVPPPEIGILPWEWGDITLPGFGPLPRIQQPPLTDPDPDPDPGESPSACPTDAPANGPFPVPMGGTIVNNGLHYLTGEIWKQARPATHDNPTRYELYARFEKYNSSTGAYEETTEDNWYSIYAYNGSGELVATGVHDAVTNPRIRTGSLTPAAVTTIRTVTVKINDAYLVRPTGLGLFAQFDFDQLDNPQVGGAPYNGGYKATAIAYWTRYNAWGAARLSIKFYGILGQAYIHQIAYGTCDKVDAEDNKGITKLNGGLMPGVSGNYFYWEKNGAASGIKSANEEYIMNYDPEDGVGAASTIYAYGLGTATGVIYNEVYVYPMPQYRIHINGLYLYNLCPR